MNENASVWFVWMEWVMSLMGKKASWILVICIWWKGESLPSIFILNSLFLVI